MTLFLFAIFAFGAPVLALVMFVIVGIGLWRYPKGSRPAWIGILGVIAVMLLVAGLWAYYTLTQVNFTL